MSINFVHGVPVVSLGGGLKEFAIYLEDGGINCGWESHPSFPSAAKSAKGWVAKMNARHAEQHGAEWATGGKFAITQFSLYDTDRNIGAHYELQKSKWVCIKKGRDVYDE